MKNNQNGLEDENRIQAIDNLPDGLSDPRYLKADREWPNLHNRLGQPRILDNCFFSKAIDRIKKKNDLDDFYYLDAGCGYGNDLRAVRQALDGRGNYLGVDLSRAGIMSGLDFYSQSGGEETITSVKYFALGNLHDLNQIYFWDEETMNFSCPGGIKDGAIDLVYMEAVLHASGYSHKTYQEKKESAQQVLAELFRVCKVGGQFLGRVNVFSSEISKEQQFELLRRYNDWRFIPESNELLAMLKEAGFIIIKKMIAPHEKMATDPRRKDVFKISFLARK